jgi:hypothetical protein
MLHVVRVSRRWMVVHQLRTTDDTQHSIADFSSPIPSESTPTSSYSSDVGGNKFIKIGGQSVSIDSTNCRSSRVQLRDTRESSKHAWMINSVPGRDDYYYISSKAKQDTNCPKRYLTANSSCNQPMYLAGSGLADRQYFTFTSDGDGYKIQNVNCKNKGMKSYLTGSTRNKSDIELQSRGDVSFTLADAN